MLDQEETAPAVLSPEAPARYQLAFEPAGARVSVTFDDQVIAESDEAIIVRETRLPPACYFPPKDVRWRFLELSDHTTHCPFKGNATYWSVKVGDKSAPNVAWSYEDPLPEAEPVKGYLSFYQHRMQGFLEDGERLTIDVTPSAGAHANPLIDWLVREAWDASDTAELVWRFSETLLEQGVPLMRLNYMERALHPEVAARSYLWQKGKESLRAVQLEYHQVRSEAYRRSPFVQVFSGAGGVRRRLEGPASRLDFPILEDLLADGATDYAVIPLNFSTGQVNAVSLAADRPGGFTIEDLGHIYEALPLLTRLLEVHAWRGTTRSLLSAYIGSHSSERVLRGLVRRGDGEVIPAVIWLADLKDSTAHALAMERGAYLIALNQFFEATAGAVLGHGGEVLKFIGDAVFGIFPVTHATESEPEETSWNDACKRAFAAAGEAFSRIRQVNEERLEAGDTPLSFRLALHVGEVMYGNIGTPGRLDFTVVGPAVNETARLIELCKTFERDVIVSEGFARHFDESPFVSMGRHCLRGTEQLQEILAPAEAFM